MPIFVDVHPLIDVDWSALDCVIRAARTATVDRFGVRPLDHFFDESWIYCVIQAPDEAAVWQNHSAAGLGRAPIHQVAGLYVRRRLSAEHRAAIRVFVARSM